MIKPTKVVDKNDPPFEHCTCEQAGSVAGSVIIYFK